MISCSFSTATSKYFKHLIGRFHLAKCNQTITITIKKKTQMAKQEYTLKTKTKKKRKCPKRGPSIAPNVCPYAVHLLLLRWNRDSGLVTYRPNLYHTRWYDCSRTTQRTIWLAIARTQKKPIPFYELSLIKLPACNIHKCTWENYFVWFGLAVVVFRFFRF